MRRFVFHFAPSVLLALDLLTGCQKNSSIEPAIISCFGYPAACNTPATVRDLTGLDGCGKVLELANGQRLEPSGAVWRGFAATNGQHFHQLYSYLSRQHLHGGPNGGNHLHSRR